MRVLLLAEGDSDEIVAETLIHRECPEAAITAKRFPSRGFQVVRRSIPTCVRAAHFGFFDLLIIHFDLNSTLPVEFGSVSESPRWQEALDTVSKVHNSLKEPGRAKALRTLFMAPCQAVEAWIGWGSEGGDGTLWERKNRKDLKRYLFGDPPLSMTTKTRQRMPGLIEQMDINENWPRSLREFSEGLATVTALL